MEVLALVITWTAATIGRLAMVWSWSHRRIDTSRARATATTEELTPSTPAPPSSPPATPAPITGDRERPRGHDRVPEAAIVVGALVLFSWGLSKNGPGNTYYAAVVRSMGSSWKNFFYGAFDPGGWITVDKPPLAVWLQAGTVKVFGYSSWSLLLPSVVSGAGAVWLLMLHRATPVGTHGRAHRGDRAALTPMVLAVSRSNNPDATLLLLHGGRGIRDPSAPSAKRKPVWMAVAGLLCGVAFLAKLLVACVMMPGPLAGVLRDRAARLEVAPPGFRGNRDRALRARCRRWSRCLTSCRRRAARSSAGAPTARRWDLVFGYNGFGRITGASAGPGPATPSSEGSTRR